MEVLTEREKITFEYMVNGYQNKEIANKMNISIHTVKAHILNIIRKMKAKNRVHVAYIAGKQNFFE